MGHFEFEMVAFEMQPLQSTTKNQMLEINNRVPHCSHFPGESSREQLLPAIKSKKLSLDCMMLWVCKAKRYKNGKNIT